MKIFGQLESATLEQLSSDPASNVQGRIFDNTTDGKTKRDSGTAKRAFLINDGKAVIGNSGTANENIRIHRGGAGLVQDVLGADVTAEGTSSTSIAQRSMRVENQLDAGLPAAGNVGREVFVTDQNVIGVDDGVNWRKIIPEFANNDATSGGTISLAAITSSVVRLTGAFSTIEMIPAGFDSQHVTLVNRTGTDVVVSNDSGATPANRIYTGTGANLVLKTNSALTLKYDITTDRWQVIGQAAGAGAGGGGVPNSAVQTATSNYTVLITDDVILADSSLGVITLTLPSAAGNIGKRILIEKIGTRQNNKIIISGTVDGIANPEIWALNSYVEIMSNGSAWISLSLPNGICSFCPLTGPRTDLLVPIVGAVSTANVSLETLSAASATVIDNIVVKTGTNILLKNQSAPEENGIYTVPAVNITISATSVANEDISTLANGSVVNATVVSTGQLVSLRFQSVSSENGIYVIGATPGTTVRDISQRHASYTTPTSLKDVVVFSDWYNFPSGAIALSPTESTSSHANDMKFWKQTNDNLTTFTDQVFSTASVVYAVKSPSNAKDVEIDLIPYGGAGAGGRSAGSGGSGGGGALPLVMKRSITPGETITITMPLGSIPGTGRTGTAGGTVSQSALSIVFSGGNFPNMAFVNGAGGLGNGNTTPASSALTGGHLYTGGGAVNANGTASAFADYGVPGTGGVLSGGGGGAGLGHGGNGGNGSNAANFLGTPGVLVAGSSYGSGGGGGGFGPASGRPGRGGFAGPGLVKIKWS